MTKIYTKGEHVLGIEVILHNSREYRWGRSLPCFPEMVLRLRGILERFLNAVACMNMCFVSDELLEQLPEPTTQIGKTKVGGIDLNKPRMRGVAQPVLALSASVRASRLRMSPSTSVQPAPAGIRIWSSAVRLRNQEGPRQRHVHKIGKSRRYEAIPQGLRTLNGSVGLTRENHQAFTRRQQPSPTAIPTCPTQPQSIPITKLFALVCAASSLSLVWRREHRHRQLISHLLP